MSKADAQAWVKSFASWYNGTHLHSAIRFVTPNARHVGRDSATLANRPFSMQLHGRKNRNGGQAKPETGKRLDQSGSTPTSA